MKRAIKIISTIVLVLWTCLLVFGLSFGTDVAKRITKLFQKEITETLTTFELYDIELKDQTNYIVGKSYKLEFNVKSNDKNKNFELTYESLDTDTFTVNNAGVVTSTKFEDKTRTGKLVVKSNVDKDFEKTFELTFYNVFPDDFKIISQSLNKTICSSKKEDNGKINVGIPVYIYVDIKNMSTPGYTYSKVVYEYDEEYFEKKSEYEYIPKKVGTNISFKAYVGELVEEIKFDITECDIATEIDKITLKASRKQEDGSVSSVIIGSVDLNDISRVIEVQKSDYIYVWLYNNGNNVNAVCEVRSSNNNVASVSSKSMYKITVKNYGEAVIYIDIILDNGEKKTYDFTVVAKDPNPAPSNPSNPSTPSTPAPVPPAMDLIDSVVKVKEEEHAELVANYPKDSTFKNVSKGLTISISSDGKVLSVYAKEPGEYKATVVSTKNGITMEKEITIVVEKVAKVEIFKTLIKNLSRFVTKIMGHFTLFMVEGFLALWFVLNHKSKHKWVDILIFISIGLFIGAFTEFLQLPMFLQGRNASIKDVALDFIGYLVGGFAMLGIIGSIIGMLRFKKKYKKAND